ncbi:MAG: DUF3267 domain-containing protein [Leptolyngbyaceae cyanobacterium SL_5_9]|nr:DUF3267 domain-containing protein [Leptolyngbyaceae cyanobacterium SL_5_9]NJO72750.1 DUF3267 domain-containing protein [Leptolyngbyaceae cyanobacterium RM1_406_9]
MRLSILTDLPQSYQRQSKLDLLQNKALLLSLILTSGLLLLAAVWFGVNFALFIRPDSKQTLFPYEIWSATSNRFALTIPLTWLMGIGLAIPITMIVHEAIHGVLFWGLTHQIPRFGCKWLVAYTAPSNGLYIARDAYLIIALAPLVLLTILAGILLPFVPSNTLTTLIGVLSLNASGSAGDIAVALWLIRKPSTTVIEDRGTVVIAYTQIISNPRNS